MALRTHLLPNAWRLISVHIQNREVVVAPPCTDKYRRKVLSGTGIRIFKRIEQTGYYIIFNYATVAFVERKLMTLPEQKYRRIIGENFTQSH